MVRGREPTTTPSATGTPGKTPGPTARSPTIGSASSAAVLGPGTKPPRNTTTTRFCRAAGPQLASSRSASGHVCRHALLAGPRCGRLSSRRVWHLIKDAACRDNPPNPDHHPGDIPYNALFPAYSTDSRRCRRSCPRCARWWIVPRTRAEWGNIPPPPTLGRVLRSVRERRAFAVQFPAHHLALERTAHLRGHQRIRRRTRRNAWPNWVLGNHDQPRIASRVGVVQERSPPCYCSRCAALPRCITAMRSACATACSHPRSFRIPRARTSA